MSSYLYGVWQDGFIPTYVDYTFGEVVLGTHVGNELHVVRGSYGGGEFTFDDYTFNLTHCESYTEIYKATYGMTYAATYFQHSACNVRALEWV